MYDSSYGCMYLAFRKNSQETNKKDIIEEKMIRWNALF